MAPQQCWGPCKGQGSSTKEPFRHRKTQPWCPASQTRRSLKGGGGGGGGVGELDQAHLSSPAPIPFFSHPFPSCFISNTRLFYRLPNTLFSIKQNAWYGMGPVKSNTHTHTVKCWAISGLQMGDKGRLELHSLILKKKKKKV